MVIKHSDTVAKLRLLHVERTARGLGVGKRLVDECIRFSRTAGYQKITIWTQANLLAARHLYKTVGFVCVAQESHHRFGKELVAETWERTLAGCYPKQLLNRGLPANDLVRRSAVRIASVPAFGVDRLQSRGCK
jgi:hypothetical protein